MDEKKLEHFKDKLIQKRLSLTDMVVRTEGYGREKEPAIQDVADMAVESYTKEFMFGKSSGDRAVLQMINEALEPLANSERDLASITGLQLFGSKGPFTACSTARQ